LPLRSHATWCISDDTSAFRPCSSTQLAELGVSQADINRIHRPIGLNIGSKTPAEIALATLAGLLADRAGRPGGFSFDQPSGAD
jgi:xanthine/CO dehydrogenase XdhC/CoxF family maturation factor